VGMQHRYATISVPTVIFLIVDIL